MYLCKAVDNGRFHHQWLPDRISYVPEGIDSLVLKELTGMGHETGLRSSIGNANAIQILIDGEMADKADRRGDNSACGF